MPPTSQRDFMPHVTVACVIERDAQFLLVREWIDGRERLNQPAGHLEANETLAQAAVRETLEETGWHIELTGVVGVDLYTAPANGVTYVRTTFIGRALEEDANPQLDEGIIGPEWLTRDEIAARREQLRSPMVLDIIDQYLAGRRYPLEVAGQHG
ncbi:NUDIX hydrolase [Gilvimarinus xylanilyticus]|uniref:Phosphatase NudJ n=1 Tax=Gilvimarinus xylanilyticus TaxID=2944139 RepID=A0A9X2KRT0_9GAMM|nr:NUDIX hydrolase [Gilvimarinus xylanilyticus]MCP8898166.1 NUDIX hydrolase [Gilvimarinus xylanilyticus]